ncbi:MAG: Gfo/Idh/MocA family oxidoreductase [Phycisphaeraceae bacterium]
MARFRIVGINFDHQHMGDLLREAQQHPDAEIVGVCDEKPGQMTAVNDRLKIPADRVFTDYRRCIEQTKPNVAILCPSTATHGLWTKRVAAYDLDVLVEKPFAATLAEADEMIDALKRTGRRLAINWPLAWYPPHRTTKRLIDAGRIGDVIEVHYYDGNRGPVRHAMDKIEVAGDALLEAKRESWFYKPDQGGGSLLDYLGYGTTLATWFNGGRKPVEVTCTAHTPAGLDVDEHSITIARYHTGLSKFETRWGAFTDPWIDQPQPKCGFVVVGTAGTIASYDYEDHVRLQTRDKPGGEDLPVDELTPPHTGPIAYFLHCIANDEPIEGPLSPATCRIGQQIVDTAFQSAREKRTLPLIDTAIAGAARG